MLLRYFPKASKGRGEDKPDQEEGEEEDSRSRQKLKRSLSEAYESDTETETREAVIWTFRKFPKERKDPSGWLLPSLLSNLVFMLFHSKDELLVRGCLGVSLLESTHHRLGHLVSPKRMATYMLRNFSFSPIALQVSHPTPSTGSQITCMEFDRIGSLLAVGSKEGTLHIYDFDEFSMLQRGECTTALLAPLLHLQLGNPLSSVSWHPTQPDWLFVTSSRNPSVELLDLSQDPNPSLPIASLSFPRYRGFTSVVCWRDRDDSIKSPFPFLYTSHLFCVLLLYLEWWQQTSGGPWHAGPSKQPQTFTSSFFGAFPPLPPPFTSACTSSLPLP